MIPSKKSLVAYALGYATRGWQVFPAPPGEKKSYKSAKFSNGRNWGATADQEEIKKDWRRWPAANIGIRTGPDSGIFVVEADTPEGHGVDGIAALHQLQSEHGPLGDTLRGESPSGSLHYYFRWPNYATITNSASKIAPGVDVRGEGGMVIAPPSVKPGMGAYRWLNEGRPIAEAPDWLVELARREPPLAANRDREVASRRSPRREPPPDWLIELTAADAGKGVSTDPSDLPPPTTIEKIIAALAAVDPDTDHHTWIAIGAALFSELGDANGFALWDEWSSHGRKYPGRRRLQKHWDAVAGGTYGWSIGTLFFHASEADCRWFEFASATEAIE